MPEAIGRFERIFNSWWMLTLCFLGSCLAIPTVGYDALSKGDYWSGYFNIYIFVASGEALRLKLRQGLPADVGWMPFVVAATITCISYLWRTGGLH